MMFLKPDGKIDLEHRAHLLRGTPSGSLVIAAAREGQFSIIIPHLNEIHLRRLPSSVRAVYPHPSEGKLAWIDDKSGMLFVQDYNGSRHLTVPPPHVNINEPKWAKQGFHDCFYSGDGQFLWMVAPLNAGAAVVQLHEEKTGATVNITIVKPFEGSSLSFHPTGKPDCVSLWKGGAKWDMLQVHRLAQAASGFTCTLVAKQRNTTPPVFSPDGGQFLVVNNSHQAICKFGFPALQQVGLPLKLGEDNIFPRSLCYLTNHHALATTTRGRIFVLGTVQMEFEYEISIEGHEPRPIGEYYSSWAEEKRLATDITYFNKFGDTIIFVYRRDGGTGPQAWKDTLCWLSVKDWGKQRDER